MTDQTIAGPGPDTLTQQDIADRERRILVQGCFKEDSPALTKQLMLVHWLMLPDLFRRHHRLSFPPPTSWTDYDPPD